MFRTITILSLENWAINIAPLFGAQATQVMENKSQEILKDTEQILYNVLEDNDLNYGSIKNNISINFDHRWGIRIETDSNRIPYFKYLDQGYGPFDMKSGIFNGRLKKHIAKDGRQYVNVPIKDNKYSEVKFRRMYRYFNKTPNNWWHPGYKGKHILDKTVDRAGRLIKRKIKNSFSELLGV